MKKAIFCLLASFSALLVFGATQEERDAAQKQILDGVSAIDCKGAVLGPVMCMGTDSFPLIECRTYANTVAYVAAGTFFGAGRAVYFGHPALFDPNMYLGDMEALLKNSIRWLAKDKEAELVKIGVYRDEGFVKVLQQFGYDGEPLTTTERFGEFDIVTARSFPMEDGEAFIDFVRKGGGLLGSGLGWGYRFYNPTHTLSASFGDNMVFGPMGMIMADGGVNKVNDSGYLAVKGAPPAGAIVDDAIDLAVKGEYKDAEERKRVSKTLALTIDAFPPAARPDIMAKFLKLIELPEAQKVPSPDSRVGVENVLARIAIIAKKSAWLSDPVKVWPADPAASVYPGLVKEGTPSVAKTVTVDCSVPRWHSTGLFSPAGQALTVKVSEEVSKLGLFVRIGTTADDVTGNSDWARAPMVTVEIPIDKTELTFATPFGGLVYVVVPQNNAAIKEQKVEVAFDGAVASPHFKLGRDTNEDFMRQCRESGAPQGEIEGPSFIITCETECLKKVEDPKWIAEYWEKVLLADLELIGKKERKYPERICSDVQLTGGWLHNGYPLMFHINRETHFDWVVNKDGLAKGDGWGVFHEIGHNHQNYDWTPEGAGEVTVNLFTCYAIEQVSGANIRNSMFPTATRPQEKRVRNWVGRGKKFSDWKGDYFLALEMYLRLKEAYGWESYRKVFGRYNEPGFRHPANDGEKWNIFAEEFSAAVNENVAKALAEWSIPLSEETLRKCAAYPDAKASITAGLIRKPYVSPKTEPVDGLYMGVCLAGRETGKIEFYKSREAVPGGEQAKRWKTDWLLLRRIEPTLLPVMIGRAGTPPESKSWEAEREIEITKPYYVGVYEITQKQWFNVMGQWKGDTFKKPDERDMKPVNGVSYVACRGGEGEGINWPSTGYEVSQESFAGHLREITGFRVEFDLPTEAQWEYACRAGTEGDWNNGEDPQPYQGKVRGTEQSVGCDHVLDKLGRYAGNGGEPDGPAVVGSYEPNAWGLYDMHGNVYESVLDWFWPAWKAPGVSGVDPVGPAEPEKADHRRRVMRGGTWWNWLYGGAGPARSWSRGLGNEVDPGTSHGAAGLRIFAPAAMAKEVQFPVWAEKLPPEAIKARTEMLDGVQMIGSRGLPGPVYCLSSNAFPLVSARTWDKSPACMAAASFFGKGRVVVVADDPFEDNVADNRAFRKNAERWLSGGAAGKVRKVNLGTLSSEEAGSLAKWVADGGGLFAYGRAWPWRQKTADELGAVKVADWPGNVALAPYGLMIGDFCVARTAADGFNVNGFCAEGCAVPPPEAFEIKNYAKMPEAVKTPEVTPDANGILVHSGETILFLGDSITRLGGDKLGYINLVIKGLEVAGVKDVGKVPAGWDGQHSGDMLGRVGGLLSDSEVKVMTLMCGVNDVWGYDWDRGVELEEYKRNVAEIYNKAASAGVLVVAMTPTLIQEEPGSDRNRILDPFAEFIRQEAAARGLPLADCRAAEIEGLKAFPENGEKHFTYDGVHPVWEGHKMIARCVLKALGVPAKFNDEIDAAWEEMKKSGQ